MYSLLIFDLDGTIYDSDNPISKVINYKIKKYIMKIGKLSDSEYINLEKNVPDLMTALKKLKINKSQFYKTIYETIDYNKYFHKDFVLRNMLLNLKPIKIICTNSCKYHVKNVLFNLGINDLFYEIYCTDEFPDKRKIYELVLKKYKILPEQICVIGDNYEVDLLPAKQLGFKTIYISRKGEIKCVYDAIEKITKKEIK